MTHPIRPNFVTTDIDAIKDAEGRLVVFVAEAAALMCARAGSID